MTTGERPEAIQSNDAFIIGPASEAVVRRVRPEDLTCDYPPDANEVARQLRQRELEFNTVLRLTERINLGVTLEDVLDFVYDELRALIPYDRIGFSLVDHERGMVVARWARSDRPMILTKGYEAPLEGSTLKEILLTGRPRIINDLEGYLRYKPQSESTALVVREGMTSSFTCPLIVQGNPIGFIFFSSVEPRVYSSMHSVFFQQITGLLSAIVEKGRLYSELTEQKAVIERQNQVMVQELEMARQVQRTLIPDPKVGVEGLAVALEYEPTLQVGGDVLDIIELGDGRVLFFIGDAMGHGVQAALVMAITKTALQSAVQADPRPARVLERMNQVIIDVCHDSFVTGAACLVDPTAHVAEFALAGHAWPCWYRAETGQVVKPGDVGLPMGIEATTTYERIEIDFRPEDVLLFCTDGVFEAIDEDKNFYGYGRLQQRVAQDATLPLEELLASIKRDVITHVGGRAIDDDWSLLAIRASAEDEAPG